MVNGNVKSSCAKVAKPHVVIILRVAPLSPVSPLIVEFQLAAGTAAALQPSFLFHRASASTALLNPILANTWSLDKRPNTSCTSVWDVMFSLWSPNLAAIAPRRSTPCSAAASLIQKKPHSLRRNSRWTPRTFCHLSFRFELGMGLCSCFLGSWSGEYFQGPVRKNADRY